MKRSLSLSGIPVSPGIAVGRAAVWLVRSDSSPRRDLDSEEVPTELERLRLAVESAIREIGEMAGQVEERLGKEYAAIFQAHALFLRDPSFLGPIEKKIRIERVNAEWAVEVVADALAARLRDLPDQDLALRASDLDDVAAILRRSLGEGEAAVDRLASLTGDSCVLVADELTPSDAVRIPRDKVVAFVTERGGKTSHAAILARSFGLPAVVAIPKLLASIGDGDRLIVDGREGVVWREPSEDVLALFRERQGRDATREHSLKERSLSGLTRTRDGEEVSIRANIELAREVPDVFEYGADGVGLFRSEFLYLSGAGMEFPDEATQAAIYRDVVAQLAPRPVVIRTYDLGGKKGARHLSGAEENPVLGLRGVRLCFSHPEMFRTQLRALLSVASEGDLRILVPMVAGVEDIRRVRTFVEEARRGAPRARNRGPTQRSDRSHDRGPLGGAHRRPDRSGGRFPFPRHERPDAVHPRGGPGERGRVGHLPAAPPGDTPPRGQGAGGGPSRREAPRRLRRDGCRPGLVPAPPRPRHPGVLDGPAFGSPPEGRRPLRLGGRRLPDGTCRAFPFDARRRRRSSGERGRDPAER